MASRGTGSRSRSDAATRCRSRRSARSSRSSSGCRSRRRSPRWEMCGGRWCTTRSCAGSVRRRASCTWRSPPSINALWDLAAKRAGKPLWKLLAEHVPGGARRARGLPVPHRRAHAGRGPRDSPACAGGRAERTERLLEGGYPAYTTTPGWLGYADAKLARLCEEAVEAGYEQVKLKVGAEPRGRRPAHGHRARGVRS